MESLEDKNMYTSFIKAIVCSVVLGIPYEVKDIGPTIIWHVLASPEAGTEMKFGLKDFC